MYHSNASRNLGRSAASVNKYWRMVAIGLVSNGQTLKMSFSDGKPDSTMKDNDRKRSHL